MSRITVSDLPRCSICGGSPIAYKVIPRKGVNPRHYVTVYIECESCGKRAGAMLFEESDSRDEAAQRWKEGRVE